LSPLKKVHDECLDILHGFTNAVIREKRQELASQVVDLLKTFFTLSADVLVK
jgi:hypothetical protein